MLEAKKADGTRLKIDDPALKPVWDLCARLDIPVLIHTAEPQEFFSPLDYENERWLELALFADRRNYMPGSPRCCTTLGASRDFFIKYQDRVLFGKDSYQPNEFPYYWRVFETKDEYFDYYRNYHAFWKLYGMDLPDEILKKLYDKNAQRITRGLPQSPPRRAARRRVPPARRESATLKIAAFTPTVSARVRSMAAVKRGECRSRRRRTSDPLTSSLPI